MKKCEFIKGCNNFATTKINGEYACDECIKDILTVLQEIKICKTIQESELTIN